ncbi:MAG: hypothetical protein WA902_10530 [Thermosynechococcaceae cyanobacterium]
MSEQDPYRIDADLYQALQVICEYLADEEANYAEMPEEQRQHHVYPSVKLIADRLESMPCPDSETMRVADQLNRLLDRE